MICKKNKKILVEKVTHHNCHVYLCEHYIFLNLNANSEDSVFCQLIDKKSCYEPILPTCLQTDSGRQQGILLINDVYRLTVIIIV